MQLSSRRLRDSIQRSARLLASSDPTIAYFTKRDILFESVGPIETLWDSKDAKRILGKQLQNGSWGYPNPNSKKKRPLQDYDQLETYRLLGQLVEKFGFDNSSKSIKKAAAFLFTKQTGEGDFRGIYGRQFTPNYTAGIMELLIKAGYSNDRRISKAFEWLLSVRQKDGGWAIPLRTAKLILQGRPLYSALTSVRTVQPDLTRTSSHLVTGVVLRAFAAHKERRETEPAITAGEFLSRRLFKKDAYVDRGAPEYWAKVAYPFWFTDIVSALDSLSMIGSHGIFNSEIEQAIEWLLRRQTGEGLFELKLLKTGDPLLKYWVALAICRILKRYESRV